MVVNFSGINAFLDCEPSVSIIRSGPHYAVARFPPERVLESDVCEVDFFTLFTLFTVHMKLQKVLA